MGTSVTSRRALVRSGALGLAALQKVPAAIQLKLDKALHAGN
jgi:hypothetical protein